jgi:polyhydroxybutyrate depolymerase
VQNLAAWAALNRCRAGPTVRRIASSVVERSWTGCRVPDSVLLYTVVGGGHTWPGSPITLPASVFGPTTEEIDATGLMLGFFGRLHRQ